MTLGLTAFLVSFALGADPSSLSMGEQGRRMEIGAAAYVFGACAHAGPALTIDEIAALYRGPGQLARSTEVRAFVQKWYERGRSEHAARPLSHDVCKPWTERHRSRLLERAGSAFPHSNDLNPPALRRY